MTCCCALVAIVMADPESSGKVVLVCLGDRNREVQFCEAPSGGSVYAALEAAIRRAFDDVGTLKSSSSLILQVCRLCMYFVNRV